MNKNIIIGIHGIKTRRKHNWIRIFELHLKYDPQFKNWLFLKGNYGYLEWFWCIVPFVKNARIKWFSRYLRKIQKKYPGCNINIIAHSYGTMLTYEAIRRAGDIKINTLVLVGGIVSSHENFKDTIGKGLIKRIFNYCSYKDRVVRFNPWGHCGYWGFLKPGDREYFEAPSPFVYNQRYEITHSQWFDDEEPDFYKMWRKNLILGGNHA